MDADGDFAQVCYSPLEMLRVYILYSGMFLITAAIANGLKQMAMLTSSSTRNTNIQMFIS